MKITVRLALMAMAAMCAAGIAAAQSINAAGATFPEPIYKKWFSDYKNAHAGVEINYQARGSGAGITQLTAGTVDFGASDRPLTDAEMAQAADQAALLPDCDGRRGSCVQPAGRYTAAQVHAAKFLPIFSSARSLSGTTRLSPR